MAIITSPLPALMASLCVYLSLQQLQSNTIGKSHMGILPTTSDFGTWMATNPTTNLTLDA